MGEGRFKKIFPEDELKIKGARIILSVCVIVYILSMAWFMHQKVASNRLAPVGEFTFGQLLGVIAIILFIVSAIVSIVVLKRLTRLIYSKSILSFILYLIMMILGFEFYLPLIIVVLVIWLESRRIIREPKI